MGKHFTAGDLGNATKAKKLFAQGQNYYFGYEDCPQSYEEAFPLLEQAANLDWTEAFFYLALCYDNGRGVDVDKEKAADWYHMAAEREDSNAQVNLGIAYEIGSGVKGDLRTAAYWYDRAAKNGHKLAGGYYDAIKGRITTFPCPYCYAPMNEQPDYEDGDRILCPKCKQLIHYRPWGKSTVIYQTKCPHCSEDFALYGKPIEGYLLTHPECGGSFYYHGDGKHRYYGMVPPPAQTDGKKERTCPRCGNETLAKALSSLKEGEEVLCTHCFEEVGNNLYTFSYLGKGVLAPLYLQLCPHCKAWIGVRKRVEDALEFPWTCPKCGKGFMAKND